jgi:quinol---cytochrome-c reductase cytochrome c subunit
MVVRLCLVLLLSLSLTPPGALCQQAAPSTAPNAAPSTTGRALYQQHCVTCHGANGEGVNATISFAGPPLIAVHNPATVMTAMEVGPSHMPRFGFVLRVDQMRAVADYVTQNLATLSLQGGDLGKGGELFRLYCAACHGPEERGDVLAYVGVNPPSLASTDGPIVAGMIRMGPGPMPKFPPAVLSDRQVASIVDYVQYMQHPQDPGGSPLGYYGPVAEGFIAWIALFAIIGVCGWIEKGGKG